MLLCVAEIHLRISSNKSAPSQKHDVELPHSKFLFKCIVYFQTSLWAFRLMQTRALKKITWSFFESEKDRMKILGSGCEGSWFQMCS